MDIDIKVKGFIAKMKPPEVIHSRESGFLVNIGFFLEDILTVFDEDGDLTKSQHCYEQKIVTEYSMQICDVSYVEQLAYNTLHVDMDMDPEAAEKAKAEVARTIMSEMEMVNNSSFWIVFMDIRVECTIEISEEEAGKPSGQHGYDRFLQRLGDDDCAICCEEFRPTVHIAVTTCHHTYHSLCLFEWFFRGTYSCPTCRSDLAPVANRRIKF
ncbi:hypothetical protein EJ110_NYTH34045 [Nymphaea thermarum]|nr:hypothetical protein EJ110_NYTH34045 [Nymphaea thermarum]